ncbi:hypothetical protein FA950_30110 [Bacillus thuringiensis]|uniref:hypothetical protein n=1 Tax=Bacillus thuringiensis TaxID=1428 RepID=UPI0010AD34AF|nr:hypothetical protein [Bacillus thuringiensis]TJZ99681.1 hypothetical protein FA950_30110 [Bacillus thuringiensis]
MVHLDSSCTQIPTQAMLDATFFSIEQHCLLCLRIVSRASSYDSYEQEEVSHTIYESLWIFQVLIQNIVLHHPDIVNVSMQCNAPVIPSHTLDRMKNIRHLLQKLRKNLRTFSFLDPDQKCSILLQMLLCQQLLNTNVAKISHNHKASPPWLNPTLF